MMSRSLVAWRYRHLQWPIAYPLPLSNSSLHKLWPCPLYNRLPCARPSQRPFHKTLNSPLSSRRPRSYTIHPSSVCVFLCLACYAATLPLLRSVCVPVLMLVLLCVGVRVCAYSGIMGASSIIARCTPTTSHTQTHKTQQWRHSQRQVCHLPKPHPRLRL